LEGGDVLRVGKTLLVGLSHRTSEDGSRALAECIRRFGYTVVPVHVLGCLHLKSACCALDEQTLLVNREWIETAALSGFRLVNVAEPFAANVLRLPDRILTSTAYPATAEVIRGLGHRVAMVDVSELHKAESGLTCMGLLFESGSVPVAGCGTGNMDGSSG
jgi:dimethylargininase